MPDRDDEIDGLYALEPGEFVAARNALTKRIKADGDKERAAEVAKLPKPSIVAWALNRTVRDDPQRVAALIDAVERLTTAQADLMAGGDREALRTATTERRATAGDLVAAAAGLTGRSHTDALRTTLDAALVDPELVERLRTGTLSDTLDAPAGFGFGFDAAPATPTRARSKAKTKTDAKSSAKPRGKAATAPAPDEDEAAAEAAEREQRRAEARAVVARIEAEVAAAAEAVDDATTEAEQTDDEVRDAEDALAAARLAHSEATAALTAAQEQHVRVTTALDDARRLLAELGAEPAG